MKKLLQEFKEFALRGNVMDLAVGVAVVVGVDRLENRGGVKRARSAV